MLVQLKACVEIIIVEWCIFANDQILAKSFLCQCKYIAHCS